MFQVIYRNIVLKKWSSREKPLRLCDNKSVLIVKRNTIRSDLAKSIIYKASKCTRYDTKIAITNCLTQQFLIKLIISHEKLQRNKFILSKFEVPSRRNKLFLKFVKE